MTQTTLFSSPAHDLPPALQVVRTFRDWPETTAYARNQLATGLWSLIRIGSTMPEGRHQVVVE